jgi:hypothetical protein
MNCLETALLGAIEQQQRRLLVLGRTIVPNLSAEDLLQPNDYPSLESHSLFRYEEGVLEGLLSARALIRAELELSDESLHQSESR